MCAQIAQSDDDAAETRGEIVDDLTRTVVVVGFVVVAGLLPNIFRLLERIEQLLTAIPSRGRPL